VEQRRDVGDVMQRHRAHDEIDAESWWRGFSRQIELHRGDICYVQRLHLVLQLCQHPWGTVHADNPLDIRLECQCDESGAASKIQRRHVRAHGYVRKDRLRDVFRHCETSWLLVPGGGGVIKTRLRHQILPHAHYTERWTGLPTGTPSVYSDSMLVFIVLT
jgi:hypothetical protein